MARMAPGRTTREALLDAAYDVVVAGSWETARMLDVATTAGVSRQTLYNEFGSKDALAEALDQPVDAVAAVTASTLHQAADNPLLKATLTNDAGGLLPFLTTRGEPVVVAARASMERYFTEHWPHLPAGDVALAAEALTRLTISYLVLPSDAPDASAEVIAEQLAHVVDRLLTTSG
jgi:AcrR family transcriptional regulator